jgi:hypothetical protein
MCILNMQPHIYAHMSAFAMITNDLLGCVCFPPVKLLKVIYSRFICISFLSSVPKLPGPVGHTAQPDFEAVGRDRSRNPSPPGPVGKTAQPDVEAIGRDRSRNPSPPEPVTERYSKSRWPLISGMMRLLLLKYTANTAFVCH